MQLNQCKTFDEGINRIDRDLLAFIEHNVQTLKQRDKVFSFDGEREGLLKQALKNGVEGRDKVFLVYVKRGSCTDINDLEGTQETSQDVRDTVSGVAGSLTLIELNFEILAHDSNQVPNDLQVDILGELGKAEEDGTQMH